MHFRILVIQSILLNAKKRLNVSGWQSGRMLMNVWIRLTHSELFEYGSITRSAGLEVSDQDPWNV
jgi:hypothetical protein